MVGAMDKLIGKIPFIHFVIYAYNFHVQSVNESLGCPFAGLTAVTKELLLSGTLFLTMALSSFMAWIMLLMSLWARKSRPYPLYGRCHGSVVAWIRKPCRNGLKANELCLHWIWKVVIHRCQCSLHAMVAISSPCLHRNIFNPLHHCPLLRILPAPKIFHNMRWVYSSLHDPSAVSYLLVYKEIIEEANARVYQRASRQLRCFGNTPWSFQTSSGNDEGTLYCESMLIGRRFILLVFKVFIADMMLRMVSMATACLLITIHHISRNPYHSPLANKAETCSLAALTVMSIINLAKATLISFGITIGGPGKSYMAALEWLEVSFLAFAPALVSLLVAFAVLSQLVRLLRFLTSRLRYCFSMFFSFLWIRTKSEDLFYMLLNSTDTENENKALLNFFNVFCL